MMNSKFFEIIITVNKIIIVIIISIVHIYNFLRVARPFCLHKARTHIRNLRVQCYNEETRPDIKDDTVINYKNLIDLNKLFDF